MYLPLIECFSVHPKAREAHEDAQGALRESDGVLFQPTAGLHQRAQSGWQYAGHVEQTQLYQTVHAGRVCHGAGENPQGHAPRPLERRETQLYTTEGTETTNISNSYGYVCGFGYVMFYTSH